MMRTRSTDTISEPRTPSPMASPDKAVSTRLRSRVKSKAAAAAAVDETPQTPTRRARSAAHKTASDQLEEVPATPTRRSTRAAAMRANDFLHETAELLKGRRRTPAAAKKAGVESSGDDAPPTPTRRARTPRTPAARKARPTALGDGVSEDEPLEGSLPLGSPTPASTRGSSNTSDAMAVDTGSDLPEATPRRRGRPPKAASSRKRAANSAQADAADATSAGLPPLHPDLASAAHALASMAVSRSVASTSPQQSVDENFRTAPETPELRSPRTESGSGRAEAAGGAARGLAGQLADDISDLSDMEDPHFTAIMTAEAESVTISAAGSISGSVCGGSDDEDERRRSAPSKTQGIPAKSTHVRFDSDAEPASGDDEGEGEGEGEDVAGRVPTGLPVSGGSDSNSDSDDEAPEVITSKATGRSAVDKPADDEALVPSRKAEMSAKVLKKRRAKHRKRAAAAAAAETMKAAVEAAVRRKDAGHSLPAAVPAELRPTASEIKEPARPAVVRSDRLDASVLEAFGAEADGKRKRSAEANSETKEAKRKSKKHKKRRNGLSRVVSGIRVVAAKPATSTSLLEALSQDVPDNVRRFKNQQHGGNRVERSVPLDAIARRHKQPAVSFFK